MKTRRVCETILITDIPLPPSVNQMYSGGVFQGHYRRYPSKKFKDWANLCNQDYLEQGHIFRSMRALLEKMLDDQAWVLYLKLYFFVRTETIYCKDGGAKRWDVSNYIKPVEDLISDVLDYDDRMHWKISAEKIEITGEGDEHVNATISPIKARDNKNFLNIIGS